MEIISVKEIKEGKEVVVLNTFLFIKYKTVYREIDGVIMRYENGNYKDIGLSENLSVRLYFNLKELN